MEEEWRPVPSYPEILVSSIGRVKLPETTKKMPKGGARIYTTSPTFGSKAKANKNARHEYYHISNRKYGNLKVHRLVCEAFHGEKPEENSVVIHIDENALNNRAENLRWGTQKENLNMPGFIEYCKSRTGDNSPVKKGKKG